jgi:hypothetical protein
MPHTPAKPAPAGSLAPASALGVVSNPPNPSRLFKSLRDSGYSNDAAVADIVDNCIDAEANRIRISVEPANGRLTPDETRIVIADDGRGMSLAVLREAMKLGSETPHDLASDLGKFGMGLITAAISMGRRLTVITKTVDGDLLRATHDLGTIEASNAFIVEISAADHEALSTWEQFAISHDHGTLIIVSECDQLAYANAASFVTRLKKHLGQVFRLFIVAKSKNDGAVFDSFISVNGSPIYANDPLMLEENREFLYPRTRDLIAGSFADFVDTIRIEVPIDPSSPNKGTDEIVVRIVNLQETSSGLSTELGINAPNSGIYVMRNQREIAPAQTLGVFARAQALTGFRAEMHVPATLDKRIGINWTKQRVEPDEQLQTELKRRIGPHVASVRKRYNKRNAETQSVDHKAYETLISKKSKLLDLPKTRGVRRTPNANGKKGTVAPKGTDVTRTGTGALTERMRDRCVFREAPMTSSGPLWEPDMDGAKIIITFNTDHPLWTRFVVERDEAGDGNNTGLIEVLHLLSFCLTSAEFSVFGDEEYFQRLVNMRQQLSNNMRVLLT